MKQSRWHTRFHSAVAMSAYADTAKLLLADERFKAIYSEEWTRRKQQFLGVDNDKSAEHDDRPSALDAKSQAARLKYWEDVLHKLDAIPAAELSAENKVNLAVYRPQIDSLAAGIRFRDYEMPFNSDSQVLVRLFHGRLSNT